MEDISAATGISSSLVEKLVFTAPDKHVGDRDLDFLRDFVFMDQGLPERQDELNAALRVWKGPALFKRGMDWRISVSRRAREALFEGKDLVEVASGFRIQRRELVRILSVSLSEAVFERDRFLDGLVKPSVFTSALG